MAHPKYDYEDTQLYMGFSIGALTKLNSLFNSLDYERTATGMQQFEFDLINNRLKTVKEKMIKYHKQQIFNLENDHSTL